jgi:hypothetical protein
MPCTRIFLIYEKLYFSQNSRLTKSLKVITRSHRRLPDFDQSDAHQSVLLVRRRSGARVIKLAFFVADEEGRTCLSWQVLPACCKTFYGRKLRLFIVNWRKPFQLSLMFVSKATLEWRCFTRVGSGLTLKH